MTNLCHLLTDISSGHHVDLTHRPTIGFKSKLEVIEFFYKIIISIQSKELDSQRQYGAAAQLKGDHEALKGTSKKTSTRRREVPSSKKRSHRAEQEKPKEAADTVDPPGRPSETREEDAFSEYLSAATSCMQYLLMLVALYTATAMCGGHYLRAFKAKATSSKPANKRHTPSGISTKHCAVSSRPDHPDGEPSRCLRNVTGTHLAHRSILAIQLFVEAQQSNMVLFNHEVAVRGTEQCRLLAKLLWHYLLWGWSYCSQLLGNNDPSRTMDDAAKLAEDLLFPGVKLTGSQGPIPLWMSSFADATTDLLDSTRHTASKKSQHSKLKNRTGKMQLKLNKSASRPMERSSDEMKAPAAVEEEDRPAAAAAVPISAASESSGGDHVDALLEEIVDHSRVVESLVDRSDKKAVDDPGCTSDESLVFSSMYRDDGPLPDDDDEGWISIRSSANSQRPQRAPRPAVTYVRLQTRRPIRKADSSDCQAPSYSSRATVSHPSGDCLRINHTSTKPIDHNKSPKTLPVKDGVELDSSSSSAGVAAPVDASLHCNAGSSDSSHVKECSRGIRSNRTTYSPRYNAPHKNPLKYNNSHSSKKVLNSFSRPADIMSYRQSSMPITLSSSSKGIEEPVVVCAIGSRGSNSPDPAGGQLEDVDPTEHSSLSDNASETTSHEDCSTLHKQQQQLTTHSPDSVFTFPHVPVHSDNAQPSMTFYSVPVQQQQQQTGYSQQMPYQQQQGYPMMPTMSMPYPPSYTIQLPPNAPTPSVSHVPMRDLPTNESAPLGIYSEAAPLRDPSSSSALTIQLPLADSYVYPTPHFSPTHYFSPTMYPHGSYYPSNFVFASRTPSPNQQVVIAPRHVTSLTD